MRYLTSLIVLCLAGSAFAEDPKPASKPAPKPAPKPAAKPAPKPAAKPVAKPAPKPAIPQPSIKDLALAEAAKFDADHNGKIEGREAAALREEYKTNASSYLYLYDDNGNKVLEDSDLVKIPLKAANAPKGSSMPGPKATSMDAPKPKKK